MTNFTNSVIYVGVTSNLIKRVYQHKNKIYDGFTATYFVNKLVYFEEYKYIQNAILREKQMKKWNREWKIKLIEKENRTWRDLFLDML